MVQSGSDDEGLFGFLEIDMLAELQRGKKLKCCFCKQNGATLACCSSLCRKQFHLNCGRKNGATSLFLGNFQSFCRKHSAAQVLPDELQREVEVRMRCLERKQSPETHAANLKVSGEKQGCARNIHANEIAQNGSKCPVAGEPTGAQIVCEDGNPSAAEDISTLTADMSTASLSCDEQNQNGGANGDIVAEIVIRNNTEKRKSDTKKSEKMEIPERRLPVRSCKNSMSAAQIKTNDANSKRAPSVPNIQTDLLNHDIDCECATHACPMCYEPVQAFPGIESLWPPCCAADVWLHWYCVQRMALNAGEHYLKCPLCNDREMFCAMVKKQGIYVPDRDAAWELETGAFAELQQRHERCDATKCQCPRGRGYNTQKGPWHLMLCSCCGSQGCHAQCLRPPAQLFVCDDCRVASPSDISAVEPLPPSTSSERAGQRPVMTSRMSLARTKDKSPRSCCKDLDDECEEFPNELVLNVSPLKMLQDTQESESDLEIEILESDSELTTRTDGAEKSEQRLAVELTGRHVPELARLMERVKPGPRSVKMRILEKLIQEQESAKVPTPENEQGDENRPQRRDSSHSQSPPNAVVPEQNLLRNLSADLSQNCTLSISAHSEKSDDIHIAVLELDEDQNSVGYISQKVNLTLSEHQNCYSEIQNSSEAETRRKPYTERITNSDEAFLVSDAKFENHSSPKTGSEYRMPEVESVLDLTKNKPVVLDSEKFEYFYSSEVDTDSRRSNERDLRTERENSETDLEVHVSEMVSKFDNNSMDASSESDVEIYENVPEFDSVMENGKIDYLESEIHISNEEICIEIGSTECFAHNSNTNSANPNEGIQEKSKDMEIIETIEKIEYEASYSTIGKESNLNTEVDVVNSEKEDESIIDYSLKCINEDQMLETNAKNKNKIEKTTAECSKSLDAENVGDANSKECMEKYIPNEIKCRNVEDMLRSKIDITRDNEEVIIEAINGHVLENDVETKEDVDVSYLQDISSDSEIEVVIKNRSVSPVGKTLSDSDMEIFANKVPKIENASDNDVIFRSRTNAGGKSFNNTSVATVDSEDKMIDEIISKQLARRSNNYSLPSKFRKRMTDKERRTKSRAKCNSDTDDEGTIEKSRTKYPRSCNTRLNMEISSSKDKIHLKIKNRNENMDFVYEKQSPPGDRFDIRIDGSRRHSSRLRSLRDEVKAYRRQSDRNSRRGCKVPNEDSSKSERNWLGQTQNLRSDETWSSSKDRADTRGNHGIEGYPQMSRCRNGETPKAYCRRNSDWSERPRSKEYERHKSQWSKSRDSSQEQRLSSERSYRRGSSNRERGSSRVRPQEWPESEKNSAEYDSHVMSENIDIYPSRVGTSKRLIESQSWISKKREKELNEARSSMTYRTYSKLSKTDRDLKSRENSTASKRHNATPRENDEAKRTKIDLTVENDTDSRATNASFRLIYRQSTLDISPESGRAEDMIVRTKEDVFRTPVLKRRKKVVFRRAEGCKKQTDIMRFFHRI